MRRFASNKLLKKKLRGKAGKNALNFGRNLSYFRRLSLVPRDDLSAYTSVE